MNSGKMTEKKKMSRIVGAFVLALGVMSIFACENQVDPKKPGADPKDALTAKITEAETLLDSLAVSDDGTDVDADKYWVTSTHELSTALETARKIAEDPKSTDQQIKLALEELTRAYNKMNETKQLGTKDAGGGDPDPKDNPDPNDKPDPGKPVDETDPVDKDALKAEIAKAQKLNGEVEASADGADVYKEKYWVSAELKKALADALAAAQAVNDNAEATEEQVEAALNALSKAYKDVNDAKKLGTSGVDKAALRGKIDEARAEIAGVKVSSDGYDVFDSELWVSESAKAALEAAIARAEEVAQSPVATQSEVAAMAGTLNSAITVFKAAKKEGKVQSGVTSYTFLGPKDETITLTEAQTLSWQRNDSLTITVGEEFESYQWYVGGEIKNGETGNSITLNARDIGLGTYFVTLKVTTADGVPYTKTLTFIVE